MLLMLIALVGSSRMGGGVQAKDVLLVNCVRGHQSPLMFEWRGRGEWNGIKSRILRAHYHPESHYDSNVIRERPCPARSLDSSRQC